MVYNAALRAINMGYTQVYWYRDGIEAWSRLQRIASHRRGSNLKPIRKYRVPGQQVVKGSKVSSREAAGKADPGSFFRNAGDQS